MISKLRIENVTNKNFGEIPNPCRNCLYWQTTGEYSETMLKPETEHQKKKWLNRVAKAFGNCIKLAHLNDAAIGFIQYAPAKFFPRTREYASGTPSDEAIFITCLYIVKKKSKEKASAPQCSRTCWLNSAKEIALQSRPLQEKTQETTPQVLLDST